MRSKAEVTAVLALVAENQSDSQISVATGVPRRTVWDWRNGRVPVRGTSAGRRSVRPNVCHICSPERPPPPPDAYAYLLGLYLGDGCISENGRTFSLRVFLDAAYPGIIAACASAVEAVAPGKRVWQGRHHQCRCVVTCMYWNHWPCLFPQHGPGRKYSRRIALEPWQEAIVRTQRRPFIRGLIHSDGCRVVANDRGVRSVRYHFSNRSQDIKTLYCESLDALGIRWTTPCDREIAVYRKRSTALLDEFVGPKR